MIHESNSQVAELRSKMVKVIEEMTTHISNGGSVLSELYILLRVKKQELQDRITILQNKN